MFNYTEAMKTLQANKTKKVTDIVRWDAGDGYIGEGHYCARRKRIITKVITPSGHSII